MKEDEDEEQQHELEWREREEQDGQGKSEWHGTRNEANAAAGARSGTSGSPKMRPALQREQHFEETSEMQTPENPVCVKKQYVEGGRHERKPENESGAPARAAF